MSVAIKAENVSKAYQLGEIGTGTISRDLERWLAKKRGKEDPFLRVGEVNDRTVKGESDIVWSLRDINFEIEQGDAVGIIGRNGAGKSTLLKLLSRVTSPTTGIIKARGRIASLLEVGTGFHPDLTGRENIYLNGAILGMRKKEITQKFDEIVAFSGVEKYIDTPVKRYSSGMYVRLAFAVAAHLDSEILIVDEVLAVGDAEFQTKCLGKMGEVSKGEGRTVLFVSHNMSSIQKLCNKGVYLHNGEIFSSGEIKTTINNYLNNGMASSAVIKLNTNELLPSQLETCYVNSIYIEDIHGNLSSQFLAGQPWQVRVIITSHKNLKHFIIALGITTATHVPVFTSWSLPQEIEVNQYEIVFKNTTLHLSVGNYFLTVGLSEYERVFQYLEFVGSLEVLNVKDESIVDNPQILRISETGILINSLDINMQKLEVNHV